MCIFTLLRTLSKPGLSTIALIICFNEFKDSETIFDANECGQCQTSVYFVPETVALDKSSGRNLKLKPAKLPFDRFDQIRCSENKQHRDNSDI